ncbi:MAG: hypothetical protein AAF602_16985, partial [Myxococcota bacterium]
VPGPKGKPILRHATKIGKGKPILRHATKIGKGGTRDHNLDWYLRHLESYTNWEVLGISVLEPVEPLVRSAPVPTTDATASTEGAGEPTP